ncbi:GDSL-type esterase/lipase family protein [Leptolyngbya sp. FACHB-261]|uniref:GDSL-type esterase/lipase family protein n=1 Tax=Leptolyngbya sp. FACHB-261 TaxID=2692806 RepID=UPI0016887727|nr:GDSL-type esterase/lipase family protein [Leptolyngbya sp. FACHB-261]MBD2101390.1 lipase [Leptolyngbya sp. FACHB-261]
MRICFVGDSFVNGTGDSECLGWTGRVCAAARQQGHDLTYYNLGIRRETTTDIRARWQAEVERRLPESCDGRVVFSFGVNDTTIEQGQTRVQFADSLANTHQILSLAQQRFPVLMVGPLPVTDAEQNSRIGDLSTRFGQICAGLKIPYLEAFSWLLESAIWRQEALAGDGYHPSAGGYTQVAELVQSWPAWRHWFKSY